LVIFYFLLSKEVSNNAAVFFTLIQLCNIIFIEMGVAGSDFLLIGVSYIASLRLSHMGFKYNNKTYLILSFLFFIFFYGSRSVFLLLIPFNFYLMWLKFNSRILILFIPVILITFLSYGIPSFINFEMFTPFHLFGKVYFPRITIPISNIFIGMLQFFVQFIVFVCFLIYFYFSGSSINIDFTLIFIPLLLFQVAITGLGFGLMISSLTSKYRDLTFVMSFGVQLWMYATPIVYPLSLVSEKYRILFCLNPMTSVVESFRYIFFKESVIKLEYIFISIFISILVLILGMIFFNKTEKSFLDTV
jgi:ABC-type polysaccharide/polyol phosphate export permease